MATGPMQNVLKHLREVLAPRRESGASDAELLERFFSSHDDAAFELLVWRHHRMVLGVCSRLLADSNDIEDAFQATFLVLARKGRSIHKRGSLSSWLFGVARRVALEASRGAQRLQPSGLTLPSCCPEPVDELMRQELRGIVDEELGHLPEKYRAAVVLCYLEGMTYEEAGQHLGCPKGTISTRLTRARELLRTRLAGRGLAVSAGAVATWLCANAASAGAPSSLVVSSIKAATSLAAGQATGVISTHVAALTEGVLKTLFLSKLKAVVAVVMVLGLFVTSATVLTYRTVAAQSGTPAPAIGRKPVAVPQNEEKDGFTAWGKEVGGLQAGLGYDPGQKRAYGLGETARLVLRVRNVTKEAVKFEYHRTFFMEYPPAVTDGQGKPVRLTRVALSREIAPEQVNLAPGQEIEVYELKFKLRPASEKKADEGDVDFGGRVSTLYGTGKFRIQYERFIAKPSGGPESNLTLSKLATGKLELEVKAEPPPANEKKAEDKKQPSFEGGTEPFTAWGKEVGGLQAGLSFRPGEQRAHRHGETAKLVVRVRNVGKNEVTFQYVSQFLIEIPPAVTDGKGKRVPAGLRSLFGNHLPKQVNLVPGKEIELYGELEVRPDFGTGKVSVQYERVFGNSSSGQIKLDPNLSKLATGKLELEIKAEPPPANEKKEQDKKQPKEVRPTGSEHGFLCL